MGEESEKKKGDEKGVYGEEEGEGKGKRRGIVLDWKRITVIPIR